MKGRYSLASKNTDIAI